MSADSLEPLSRKEIARRLQQIYDESRHLNARLPADSPHNATIRLVDISRYLEVDGVEGLRLGGDSAVVRKFSRAVQMALTRFFRDFDAGLIVKARTSTGWKLFNRRAINAALAQVAPPPGPSTSPHPERSLAMRIDLTTLGPKLRGV